MLLVFVVTVWKVERPTTIWVLVTPRSLTVSEGDLLKVDTGGEPELSVSVRTLCSGFRLSFRTTLI